MQENKANSYIESAIALAKEKDSQLFEALVLQYTNPNMEWGSNTIRDLVQMYKMSGHNKETIYNVLYGIGLEKHVAFEAVEMYYDENKNMKMEVTENLDFTSDIQKLVESVEKLRTADSANYKIDAVVTACNNYMNSVNEQSSIFEVASNVKQLISNLNKYDYIPAVKESISSLETKLYENAMKIELNGLYSKFGNSSTPMIYTGLQNRIMGLSQLSESEIRKELKGQLYEFVEIAPELNELFEKNNYITGIAESAKTDLSSKFNLLGKVLSLKDKVKSNSENSKVVTEGLTSICNSFVTEIQNNKSITESVIAGRFIEALNLYNWFKPVNETISEIIEFVQENYMSFEVDSAIRSLESNSQNKLYESGLDKLKTIKNLTESEIREQIKYNLGSFAWVPQINYLIESLNVLENNFNNTDGVEIVKRYSPILEQADGILFYLCGNIYKVNESEVSLIDPNTATALFLTLISVTESFKFGTGSMTYYKGDNSIEFKLNESGKPIFKFNGTIVPINESNELRNFLLSNGTLGINEQQEMNTIVAAFENINNFTELDFVQSMVSRVDRNKIVNTIRLNENIYINDVNYNLNSNKFVKAESAKNAIDLVKESIGYDIKGLVSDLLEGELKQEALVEKRRNQLFDRIQFLKEQRSRLSTVENVNESIKAADKLLISEIAVCENALNNLY